MGIAHKVARVGATLDLVLVIFHRVINKVFRTGIHLKKTHEKENKV
jgi:hypothetical protein